MSLQEPRKAVYTINKSQPNPSIEISSSIGRRIGGDNSYYLRNSYARAPAFATTPASVSFRPSLSYLLSIFEAQNG